MELKFVKTDPTGNTTVLVESPVALEAQPEAARRLMQDDCLCAEQVGFIETAQSPCAWARLRMMGGEFCANATMSLATFLVWRRDEAGKKGESVISVPLEVSGLSEIVECVVRRNGDGYSGTLRMPAPERIKKTTLPLAGLNRSLTAVQLPGITHVIIPARLLGLSDADARAAAERAVEEWAPLIDAEAFGILLFDEEKCSITPLVHVKGSRTTVWERGCGSGSAAIGAYIADKLGASAVSLVSQPGGVIEVNAVYENGAVTELSITGNVRIVATGTAYG
jgi:diaminopimelate epimerase